MKLPLWKDDALGALVFHALGEVDNSKPASETPA